MEGVDDVINRTSRLEVKHDDTVRRIKDISCKKVQQHDKNRQSLGTKQKSNSETLPTLTVRLNDTANTTEVLRRDVAALKLSNSDANEFWQSLSELETKQKVLQPKVKVLQRSDAIHKGEHCSASYAFATYGGFSSGMTKASHSLTHVRVLACEN